jgi:cytochrome c
MMRVATASVAVGLSVSAALAEPRLTAPDGTMLSPGISIRVYDIGRTMHALPQLVDGQTPNVSFVAPTLDLDKSRGDFGDVRDRFLSHVDGFLRVTEAGQYTLRLISDDGSRLFLSDQLIIDHDGLHAATAKDAAVELLPGLHPIAIHHFDNLGEAVLRLQWRPPGTTAFVTIPNDHLYAPADEVRVTSPGRKQVIDPSGRALLRPGDGMPLEGVHPSIRVTPLDRDDFKPRVGGLGFLSDGRLVVATWSPAGDVYILDNHAGDPASMTITRFASGLAEPLGVEVVDDRIFVLQKQELTELIDHTGDGVADEYRCVASGWGVSDNFYEFAFGLVHRDGHFFLNLAIAIEPGGATTDPQVVGRGTCIRVDPQTAGGLRTPNGIGLGPGNELFATYNQGDWLPASKLIHLQHGRHYGSRFTPPGPFSDQPETRPVVWLPQGEIGNSPSEVVLVRDGPFAGQLLHGDVTHGGIKRVYLDKVAGEYQGAVFRFTQGLTAGINRLAFAPDGALYAGGVGSGGNWRHENKKRYGLDRLDFTGAPAFEMLAVRAMRNGFEVTMTEPFANDIALAPADFAVHHWWYEPTSRYGGPKKDTTRVAVKSVTVSDDRRTVFLEIDDIAAGPVLADGLPAGRVYHLRLLGQPRSVGGREPWSTEAWYTLNAVPEDRAGDVAPDAARLNTLTEEQEQAGWRLLFNGEDFDGWRGFRRDDVPAGWRVEDGAMVRRAHGGDIITTEQFENFELSLEWKVAEGGNSGIFYLATEEDSPIWRTAPEYQVLDNARHRDGRNPRTSAASLYDLVPPREDVTRPAGEWNHARIVLHNRHVEHWLNGEKLLEITIDSDEWNRLVAGSKFRDMPHFARARRGHIGLQDHSDAVWYRNIRIRELD